MRHGFERVDVPRLIGLIDPGNEASRTVAEHAGLAVDGEVELDGETLQLYSIARPG